MLVALLSVAAACVGSSLIAPEARAATTTSSFFGVAPATSTNEQEVRRLASGGAGVARFSLNWSRVQPRADGEYDWVSIDHFVLLATRYGIDPVPQLIGSPSYAAWDEFRPPLDSYRAQRRWQQFVRAAVRRYGTTGPGSFWDGVHNCLPDSFCDPDLPIRPVRTWQVWNEPNMKLFWKPLPNVSQYAQLLRLSEQAIHGVDPGARILTGGLTPGGGRYGPAGTEFLRNLYAAAPDASRLLDGVAIHPYHPKPAEVVGEVEAIREVMNAQGDPGGGIWITEFGWATGGPPDSELVVSPAEQADRIGEVMVTLSQRRARYGLRAMMAYTDHDFRDESACLWCPYAGLMTSDGTPKPAWLRFSSIAHATPDAPSRLLATESSTDRVISVAKRGRRKTDSRVTTTVERYWDRSAIVDMGSDDVRLNRGRWTLTSCLRFLAGQRPGTDDHSVCDKQRLYVKTRGKAIPPGDRLSTLDPAELAGDPYAARPRVVGYVEAKKRIKGRWRTRLTSLGKRTSGMPLR